MENPIFLKAGNLSRPVTATGEILATICQAQVDDVDRAMQSARAAQADWEELVDSARAKISLCDRSSRAKTFAPLRGHRNIGQWKTDSGKPGY